MKINVFSHQLELTEELKSYFERRLLFAVSRFATKIQSIDAGLIDVNGETAGGIDKRCRIVVKIAGVGRLVVQDDDAEIHPLIDRTTDRLGRLIGRKLDWFQKSFGRQSASGA
ncbi:MAG: HPF/RaiA family ribosome-associated protein [Planctomycetales bacterium]|nr:HPF/RaiA family ribosome-associated protein [Planctomycetales bacterium]MBN8628638.1 HPF/RaiA family ribosome-associated protein [Planctomycetota bacterium]